jgi:hypothetical protein
VHYQSWDLVHKLMSIMSVYPDECIASYTPLNGWGDGWGGVGNRRIYTMYKEVCGQPFKWVDLAISAIPVADRCIKSNTQPCNLHRQTLAEELPYWRAQLLSTWHHHRMPLFQQVSSSNFCPARASPVNCKCCYCEVKTSRSNISSATKW